MKWNKKIFRWHYWCGLIVGIFLLLMSITGSILAFAEEIEELENRSIPKVGATTGTPSFDASFKKIQDKYPAWEIRLYHLPKNNETLIYELRQKEQSKKIYVHPVSGEIIGINDKANQSVQRQLLLFHYTLSSGTTGKIIVFINGVLFLITLITGTIIYRRSLLKVFSFKVRFYKKTARSFYSSLHRIIGVWALLFNLLIVSTGLWLSGQIALTAIKASNVKASAIKPEVKPINSIDAIVKKLSVEYPDYEIHLIRIRPGGNTVGVSGRFISDPAYYGNYYSVFSFDGETNEMISSSFMRDLSANKRLAKMAGPLHFGNYGGIALKVIYCILGLTPAILSITGFILWRKRISNRKTSKARSKLFTVKI